MQSTAVTTRFLTAADVSSILNLICPGCGGPLGGFAEEFKCQGYCRTDWRPAWASGGPKYVRRAHHRSSRNSSIIQKENTRRTNGQHPCRSRLHLI